MKKIINAFLNNQELVTMMNGSAQKIQKIYKKSNPAEESYRQESNIFSGAKTWEEQERLEWQVKFESIRFWFEYCTSPDGMYNKFRRKATSEYIASLGMTFYLGYWRDPGCREYNNSLWRDVDNDVPVKFFEAPWTFSVGINGYPQYGRMTYTFQSVLQIDGSKKAVYIMEKVMIVDENDVPYMPVEEK